MLDVKKVIWLDDCRNPMMYNDLIQQVAGRSWPIYAKVVWVKSYDEFVKVIEETPHEEIAAICFDNDLGYGSKEGRHAFTWFEERVRTQGLSRIALHAQTDNPAARREMRAGFAALNAWWREREADRSG